MTTTNTQSIEQFTFTHEPLADDEAAALVSKLTRKLWLWRGALLCAFLTPIIAAIAFCPWSSMGLVSVVFVVLLLGFLGIMCPAAMICIPAGVVADIEALDPIQNGELSTMDNATKDCPPIRKVVAAWLASGATLRERDVMAVLGDTQVWDALHDDRDARRNFQ